MRNGKILFCFALFMFLASSVYAQNPQAQRSGIIAEVNGKMYYIHTVEAGQTLSSISRAYEVSVADIKTLNAKKEDALSLQEILHIPYVEPHKSLDNNYYYHRMKPGETLYSLSQKFNIRVKQIVNENPEYTVSTPIPVGALVRLPLSQVDRRAVDNELLWLEHQKKQASLQGQITEENREGNESDETGEYSPLFPSYDHSAPHYLRVSLLLPFGLKESKLPFSGEIRKDSLGNNFNDERWRLPRNETFRQFYSGWLLAMDSLKSAGYIVDMQVYDVGQDTVAMERIVGEINHFSPHLIVGPVYADEFRLLAGRLANKRVPMIYLRPTTTNELGWIPNSIQVNSSQVTLMEEMADWISANSRNARLLALVPTTSSPGQSEVSQLPDIVANKLAGSSQSVATYRWDGHTKLREMETWLDARKENIIIFPTLDQALVNKALAELSLFLGKYKITLIGFPEWLRFATGDEEMFFRLNVKLFQNSYVDPTAPASIAFTEKYRQRFYAEPTLNANRAFDIGLFFVPLLNEYRNHFWEMLKTTNQTAKFTRVKFKQIPEMGWENRGVYLIHYSSDYEVRVHPVN